MITQNRPEPWQAFRDALLKCQAERDELLAVLMKLRRGDLHQRARPLYDEAQAAISKTSGLIAAAPQMWDIVETIAKLIDDGAPSSMILDENSPTLDAIRDVLAKVNGAPGGTP